MGILKRIHLPRHPLTTIPASTNPSPETLSTPTIQVNDDVFIEEEDNEDEEVGADDEKADLPQEGIAPHEDPSGGLAHIEALDVMTDMIYRKATALGWVHPSIGSDCWTDQVITGVSIRSKYGPIRSCPCEHRGMEAFERALIGLNARSAINMRSKAIEVAFKNHITPYPDLLELFIDVDTRIQVLDTIEEMAGARKNQLAAFIRQEGTLVVWADRVEQLIPSATSLEQHLVELIWADEADLLSRPKPSPSPSSHGSLDAKGKIGSESSSSTLAGEKGEMIKGDLAVEVEDPDRARTLANRHERPVALIAPIISGMSFAISIILMCLGIRALVVRYIYDGRAERFLLLLILPFVCLCLSFPCNVLVSCFFQIFGPIAQYDRNSAYYSSIRPDRTYTKNLLPITIQMPVYKESLEDVIIPTIESVKKATTTFERQGGTVNIIICDDGLQLLSEEERQRRRKFYADNNVAYVARPPHGQNGYERRGRFKKAGNLNHCNALSLHIEEIMDARRAEAVQRMGKTMEWWSEMDEKLLYDEALAQALLESEGKSWAEGNIRIGEVILLIDSDTRVPEDCLLDASLELSQCPEVAIIQHISGVLQVADHFFEDGMKFFTDTLQIGISLMVSNGDVAPFVGHNAFLRWAALQECAKVDPYDGQKRIWSESHVSEDFEVSLTVQAKGWTVRWATYSGCEFQEGVSLTARDELSRWQKYAWGCSEIIFNPIKLWPTRGPFTRLFLRFLGSPMPSHSKYSCLAYIISYYALALSWSMSIVNYVLIGVLAISDTFYVSSWQVFFICTLLFGGLHNVSTIILRYRLKISSAGRSAINQLKWLPFFTIFFSGLSFPIAMSLICHMIGYNMTWTSTAKSVEKSNFFLQVPRIWSRFKWQIMLSVTVIAGMIVSTTKVIPVTYRVTSIEAIIPLSLAYSAHLLWPFALDPYFTTFAF